MGLFMAKRKNSWNRNVNEQNMVKTSHWLFTWVAQDFTLGYQVQH